MMALSVESHEELEPVVARYSSALESFQYDLANEIETEVISSLHRVVVEEWGEATTERMTDDVEDARKADQRDLNRAAREVCR